MKKIKGIYLVEFHNGIKVGISDDCFKRMQVYERPWCAHIHRAEILEVAYPRVIENLVLTSFKHRKSEFIYKAIFPELKDFIYKNRFKRPDPVMFSRNELKNVEWLKYR